MTYKQNIMAILECNFAGFKEEIIESACNCILKLNPCEDYVSRQATLNAIIKELCIKDESYLLQSEKTIYNVVKNMPPVTPKIETGHWSRKTKVDAYDLAGVKTWGIKCQCDRCTFTTIVIEDFGYYTYCPNCGAKMERDVKE
jgi:hypothetical protein